MKTCLNRNSDRVDAAIASLEELFHEWYYQEDGEWKLRPKYTKVQEVVNHIKAETHCSTAEALRKLEKTRDLITGVYIYQNKRNPNKFLEIHRDGYGHQSAVQYMYWEKSRVKNKLGDRCLHRWYKKDLDQVLQDYELIYSC